MLRYLVKETFFWKLPEIGIAYVSKHANALVYDLCWRIEEVLFLKRGL